MYIDLESKMITSRKDLIHEKGFKKGQLISFTIEAQEILYGIVLDINIYGILIVTSSSDRLYYVAPLAAQVM